MSTFVASGDATDKAHHRDFDEAALEWQVDYLHEHLPFNLYAYEDDYSGGAILIAGPYTTKGEIRETLKRYPRDEFMLRFEYYEYLQVMRKRPGRKLHSFCWVLRKHKARDLPLTFEHGLARHSKVRFRQLMWLSTGELHSVGTEGADCPRGSGSVPKASAALKKYGSLRTRSGAPVSLYVKTRPSAMKRSDIVWAIASTVAAGGASADEMEAIVRSSMAFKSKQAEYGNSYSEAEIKRLRRKLYVNRW